MNLGNVENGNGTIGTHKTGSQFSHDGLYYIEDTGKGGQAPQKVSESKKGDKTLTRNLISRAYGTYRPTGLF